MERFPFGSSYRELRTSRNFTLKEAAGDIMSPQFLSRFERGFVGISIENFSRLLISIGADWEDFFIFYKKMNGVRVGIYSQKLYEIFNRHNLDVNEIFKEISQLPNYFEDNPQLDIIGKAVMFGTFENEFNREISDSNVALVDYLNKIDEWGELEISLFEILLPSFPKEALVYRIHQFIQTIKKTENTSDFNRIMTLLTIIFSTQRELRHRKEYKEVKATFEEFKTIFKTIPMAQEFTKLQILISVQESYFYLSQGDKKGIEIAKKTMNTINALKDLTNLEIYDYLSRSYYEQLLKSNRTDEKIIL